MIARVASFEGINIEAAQATMDEAEAIIRPIMEGLAGYQGGLELVSTDGKFLGVTFFDSQENAEAAEETFDQVLPAKLGDVFTRWGGRRTSVGHFMVVGDSRA
jgi:hypothetical protein